MSQQYSDPTRINDPHALPNIEVFHHPTDTDNPWTDDDGEPFEPGWYWWACFPGCLPDGDPMGPYLNEQAAIDAAGEE